MAKKFDRITILAVACLALYEGYQALTRQTCLHDLYVILYGGLAVMGLIISTMVMEKREARS